VSWSRSALALLHLGSVPALAAPTPATVQVGEGKGLTATSADGRFSSTVRTRFVPRFDFISPAAPDGGRAPALSRANIATARLWVQGHAFDPTFTYVVQLAYAGRDYRDGTISPLFDAYVDWKPTRDLNLRVGQFFVPFDRLRTVREFALQTTDRPRPVNELTLDRDVGVVLYSEHLFGDASPVAYRVGLWGGKGINALNAPPAGLLGTARLELRPLGEIDDDSEGDLERRAAPALALGAGAAYNLNTTRQKSTTGAAWTANTADYLHLAADLTFKWRGFALQGEGLYREAAADELRGEAADGAPVVEWARSGRGAVVQASYLTAANVEVVARGSRLWANPDTDPRWVAEIEAEPHELLAGLNWYKNGHRFKAQTHWIAVFGDSVAEGRHTVVGQLDMMF
jgi:hypothetical protein